MPVMSVIGKPFFIGEKDGMGQTMKLANNMLSATAMAATSEAMVMGVKAGRSPVMVDVINPAAAATLTKPSYPNISRHLRFGFATGLMMIRGSVR
jgi:3-hydroxyisobutyrate dehydrogenase-like beta-hydroxyacid dehydrogenase